MLLLCTPLPTEWRKEIKQIVVVYALSDTKDKTRCSIGLYKSIPSEGTVEQDFTAAWQELAEVLFAVTESPQGSTLSKADGWRIKSAGKKIKYNNAPFIICKTGSALRGRQSWQTREAVLLDGLT